MGVSVGRGGELAAVRSEEKKRLGGDGDGGTLLGPPGNRLNAVGYLKGLLASGLDDQDCEFEERSPDRVLQGTIVSSNVLAKRQRNTSPVQLSRSSGPQPIICRP
ncbi:hypothetical protein AV530_008611 [Patagioenas fasciata monilis]|uniref:Uncharacterized protein n=1 Tax=Patagioenas fasciata monilis TaxID=372326 RepID=A0A1V4L1A8_PATFA|nr:hypothetical protein AV530_008611 [Patagioenas fasciata monilis]